MNQPTTKNEIVLQRHPQIQQQAFGTEYIRELFEQEAADLPTIRVYCEGCGMLVPVEIEHVSPLLYVGGVNAGDVLCMSCWVVISGFECDRPGRFVFVTDSQAENGE